MNDCHIYRKQFVEAVIGDISADRKVELESHLSDCQDCRTRFWAVQTSLALYSEHGYEAPPDSFWDGYVDRLRERMKIGDSDREASLRERVRAMLSPAPSPAHVGFAIVLFLAGVLLGRATMDRAASDATVSHAATSTIAEATVERFLTRSQTLFLGFANTDRDSDAVIGAAQRETAEYLLRDAAVLRGAVDPRLEPTLGNLIDDTRLVLLNMANSGEQAGDRFTEMIKELGLPLRINLYLTDHGRSVRTVNL